MKTLEDLRIAYSKSTDRSEMVSLTEMEKLAEKYLLKEIYSTQELLDEFQVANLIEVFDGSITNSTSIQVRTVSPDFPIGAVVTVDCIRMCSHHHKDTS